MRTVAAAVAPVSGGVGCHLELLVQERVPALVHLDRLVLRARAVEEHCEARAVAVAARALATLGPRVGDEPLPGARVQAPDAAVLEIDGAAEDHLRPSGGGEHLAPGAHHRGVALLVARGAVAGDRRRVEDMRGGARDES